MGWDQDIRIPAVMVFLHAEYFANPGYRGPESALEAQLQLALLSHPGDQKCAVGLNFVKTKFYFRQRGSCNY